MGTNNTQGTQHSNPQVAKVLAFAASQAARGTHYPSAAALCRAAGVHGKANQRAVRQVLRNAYGATASRTAWGQRAATLPGGGNGKVAQVLGKAPKVAAAKAKAAQAAQAKASKAQATPQATPQA